MTRNWRKLHSNRLHNFFTWCCEG